MQDTYLIVARTAGRDRLSTARNKPPSTPKSMHCEICHSEDVRLVSGGKYRCLTCGYLPS
jgi:hypothetical protein